MSGDHNQHQKPNSTTDVVEPEPVGQVVQAFGDLTAVSIPEMPPVGTKLYAAPPQREWVGLTDEEINNTYMFWVVDQQDIIGFGKSLETKIKRKNT